ncbi:MAG: DUF4350 domain-containing protein [Candidatus Bathyarchaeia archaeon]
MKTNKLLLGLTLIIVVSMLTLIWLFPPNGDFRVENPSWNGLSTLSSKAKLTLVNTFDHLPANPKGTSLLIVPYETFSDSELSQLKNYVLNGGTLAILDDYGFGNQVLNSVGVKMRFTGVPMLDPLYNYKDKWLPKITDFSNSSIGANVSSIVFNHASSLNNTSESTVVAYSSMFSFLDVNSDGSWNNNEPNGPFPVVAYSSLGQGVVVAVADPSLMINGMIGLDDNLQFINNVMGVQGGSSAAFADQSHLPKEPLDDAKATIAVVYGAVSSSYGTLSLIAVILVLSLNSMWRKGARVGDKR